MIRYLRPDGYTLLLMAVVVIASVLPCRGTAAGIFAAITKMAIILLFFLHGAKLSREAVLQGMGAWRLHLGVTASTFGLFPLIGLAVGLLPDMIVDPMIKTGILFLAILPSTVQSSIAFTAIAGGNVAAAVCSASLSNILGVVLTPVLAGLLIRNGLGGAGVDVLPAIRTVMLSLLLPFLLGHLSRPWTARFVHRHKTALGQLDRGAILLVVYTAFSAAVIEGLWHRVSAFDLGVMTVLSLLILGFVLLAMRVAAKATGLGRAEEITLVFCGSKKSLASGVPLAAALFPVAQVGIMILPLMLFHQIQLVVCAIIARGYLAHAPQPDVAAA